MTFGPVFTGGDAAPAPTASADGYVQPNTGEGQFVTFAAGPIDWMTPDLPVYVRDGSNESLLIVVQVGAAEEGFQTVEFLNPIPAGGTVFGTSVFYGGVGP